MPARHNFTVAWKSLKADFAKDGRLKAAFVRAVALEALSDAVSVSPVDTGRYRASHDLTVNEASTWEPPPSKRPKQQRGVLDPAMLALQAERMQKAEAVVAAAARTGRLRMKIHLTTNLPYAQALEHGSSMQAPKGIYSYVRARAEARLRRGY